MDMYVPAIIMLAALILVGFIYEDYLVRFEDRLFQRIKKFFGKLIRKEGKY